MDYTRFKQIPGNQRKVLNDWFEEAWKMRESAPEEHFRAFLLSWELLGYVAEIATGNSDPSTWYPILAHNPDITSIFQNVMENKKSLLRMYTRRFAQSWPIFQIGKVQEMETGQVYSPIRATRVQQYIAQGIKEYSPPCWVDHREDPEYVPDWMHTLSVWYIVRNNLLVPGSLGHSETDVRIVSNAFLSLIYFFKEGKVFFENPSLKPDIFDRTQVLSSL
jgi:hypothetical protein